MLKIKINYYKFKILLQDIATFCGESIVITGQLLGH